MPGCSYFIEDIETSYWKRGSIYGYPTKYGVNSKKSIINSFMPVVNWINREFLLDNERTHFKTQLENSCFDIEAINKIKSIAFGKNIICIKKKSTEDSVFDNREYRFKYNLSSRLKALSSKLKTRWW